ncbi:MAG: DUF1772 domain-containing protein [Chitinophagales bacterium]|nr:DUF1772 domain-containing protein [Chitinophagales bacterium]
MTLKLASLIITILFSGLIAGLFFGYACSVNPGLHYLLDKEYVKAMQSINIQIQNFYFFLPFMGLLVLFPLSTWFIYKQGNSADFYLWMAAAMLYFVGVMGVTMAGNVPLNNQLAAVDLNSISAEALAQARTGFESNWGKYHLWRTAASVISFLLTVIVAAKKVM